jgi:EAL domain-containing protein (putative c-di-GMP-specific phosphodiesterase class I)
VETEAELAVLAAAGCRHLQGYVVSAAVPDSELLSMLDRDDALEASDAEPA